MQGAWRRVQGLGSGDNSWGLGFQDLGTVYAGSSRILFITDSFYSGCSLLRGIKSLLTPGILLPG
jgi:hypothetical protein